jgi:hypothetical protein
VRIQDIDFKVVFRGLENQVEKGGADGSNQYQ